MPTPFSHQCFIVKSFDESKTYWTRHRGNIFPFLISLQYLSREQRKLPLDPSMLIDLPHPSNSTHAIYGMSTKPPATCIVSEGVVEPDEFAALISDHSLKQRETAGMGQDTHVRPVFPERAP